MLEKQLQNIIARTVEGMSYEFVGAEWANESNRSILRVYIDQPNGVTLDDCVSVTHQLNGALDVEDLTDYHYHLEVSSPGVNRPLFTIKQFRDFLQYWVKIKLSEPISGRKKLKGMLQQVTDDEIVVVVDNEQWLVPYASIKRANIIYNWTADDLKTNN